jgi:hypothetical protein
VKTPSKKKDSIKHEFKKVIEIEIARGGRSAPTELSRSDTDNTNLQIAYI